MHRTVGIVSVVSLLLVSAMAMPVAGAGTSSNESIEQPAVHVDLEANGDATVSLVSVYDLTDEDERDAFQSLRDDDATQAALLERFTERLDGVATEIEADVDREMTVTEDDVTVRTSDERGIVTLSVRWAGLATVEDDTLVVTEPFASGFESDRALVVTAPADGVIESATPDPSMHDETRVTWAAGTDLDGFEVVATGASAESGAASDGLPGFGAVTTVIALTLGFAATGARHRC